MNNAGGVKPSIEPTALDCRFFFRERQTKNNMKTGHQFISSSSERSRALSLSVPRSRSLSFPMSSSPPSPPKQPLPPQQQQQPPRHQLSNAQAPARGTPNPRVVLEPTTKLLPSWALAGLLAAFAGATYFYSARSVSVSELSAELEREAQRQARLEEE